MYEIIYKDIKEDEKYEKVIKRVLTHCFKEENIEDSKLCITITLTTSENIKDINSKYRNINKTTDVLSFPMFEKDELDEKIKSKQFEFEDVLGDIIISIKKVEEQAKEYGHSFERELSYMIVHGFYHLMGYDHIEEEDKKVMRPKEEKILNDLKKSQINAQIKKTDSALQKVVGCSTTALRPPGGFVNDRVKKAVKIPMVCWNVDSEDWKSRDTKKILSRCRSIGDGDIVLMHDLYPTTAQAVVKLVPQLHKKGFQMVTVDELFYYKGIKAEGGTVYFSGK